MTANPCEGQRFGARLGRHGLAAAVGALLAAIAASGGAQGSERLSKETLQRPEGVRTYEVYAPASAPAKRAPLVVALHGLGGSGANIIDQGRWAAAADRHGFIVIGPDGTVEHPDRRARFFRNPRSWNAGEETGSSAATRGIDDAGFIRALIEAWIKSGRADPDRIYVTGFSNGAGMAFRVGAELSDLVAAIAPVSNALLTPVDRLARPVSLIMIWGDADPLNPYGGGKVKRTGGTVERPGAKASLAEWKSLLACAEPARQEDVGSGVALISYDRCDGGSAAQLYSISGMGHQWPGGMVMLRAISGQGSNALDATETIWSFFAAHARPAK